MWQSVWDPPPPHKSPAHLPHAPAPDFAGSVETAYRNEASDAYIKSRNWDPAGKDAILDRLQWLMQLGDNRNVHSTFVMGKQVHVRA